MRDIQLTDAQWAAVKAIVDWYRTPERQRKPVFYLAGFAGAGKSTIFKVALEEIQRYGCKSYAIATFTGKAASVLRKKGNETAQTIHSLIYIPEGDADEAEVPTEGFAPAGGLFGGEPPAPRAKRAHDDLQFALNLMGPASQVDLIALDECSMVDDVMGQDVLAFGKPVLVMGDPGQLPPVKQDGLGFFTRGTPDVMLTEVHRQALESPILRLATLARSGEAIPWVDLGAARVLKLNRANEHLVLRPDTQVICGVHRVRKEVTRRIRHARGFAGEPMAGETIICGKNNRDRKLFNGLQGVLTSAPEPYQRVDGDDSIMSELVDLEVHMDDHANPLACTAHPWMFADDRGLEVEQPRMKRGIEWFGFGYVLTCHKSQGSEWDDVTVVDDSGSFNDQRHRWLYTAITRAADRLTILRRA